LKDDQETVRSGSLRQRLEQHRSRADCRACHSRMDPLGFALENYDAVGRWRTHDGRFPVDAAGELPAGESFRGPAELKKVLRGRPEAFGRCLAEKLLTYALGRGLEADDRAAVDKILQALARDGYLFSTLVREVVHSEPFQTRRGRQE
jgi:hypothetical protein